MVQPVTHVQVSRRFQFSHGRLSCLPVDCKKVSSSVGDLHVPLIVHACPTRGPVYGAVGMGTRADREVVHEYPALSPTHLPCPAIVEISRGRRGSTVFAQLAPPVYTEDKFVILSTLGDEFTLLINEEV